MSARVSPAPQAPAAPVHVAEALRRYICHACGYIYDEAIGDPDSGLPPGTRFDDIPHDWCCPLCGVCKADFEPFVTSEAVATPSQADVFTTRHARGTREPGVVIVGAGRAGWQVAEAIRALDASRPITIVSACAGDVYDKPLLSVALARGLAQQAFVREGGADAAARLRVRLVAQAHAIRICAHTRTLRTTRGNFRYDALVLAHGARAVLPETLPADCCWRINHLDAYRRFRVALGDYAKDVVVVGAGLIGSELANDLALAGHRVSLLDAQQEPLARWHDASAGARLLAAWQSLPIRFHGGVQVAGVRRVDGRYRVDTACGAHFVADEIVVAIGLQTPTRLAQSAQLAWSGGIAVDPLGMTSSDPRIHALGDCISVDGETSRFIEPIARQARAIAAAICGAEPVPYVRRPTPVRVKTTSCPMTLH